NFLFEDKPCNHLLDTNNLRFFGEKKEFRRIVSFCLTAQTNQCKNKSAITNAANTTLAIPFVVINAMFTLRRSLGFTIECWYTRQPMKTSTPIQYSHPKCPSLPAATTLAA